MRMYEDGSERMFEDRRHMRPQRPMARCHGHGGMMRRPAPMEIDRDDLEGMYMACARMLRHRKRGRFGFAQDAIIRLLQENGDTMSQKSLQQLLGIQPASVSEVLSKMEDKGLIERLKDSEDKRASLIVLKNKEMEIEKEDFFEMLDEEEKEQLKAILNKVLDARTAEREG